MQIYWEPNIQGKSVPKIGERYWMFQWKVSERNAYVCTSPRQVKIVRHKFDNPYFKDVVTSIIAMDEYADSYVISGTSNHSVYARSSQYPKCETYLYTDMQECESTYREFVFKEVQKTKRAIDKLNKKLLYITEST